MESINNDIDYDNSEDEGSDRRNDGRPGRVIDKSWGIYLYTIAMFFNHFAYVWLLF